MDKTTKIADYIYCSNDSSSGAIVGVKSTTSIAQTHVAQAHRLASRPPNDNRIERAVYSHIRAVRALGKTRINTAEIADALSLNVNDVNHAVAKLRSKGVRKI